MGELNEMLETIQVFLLFHSQMGKFCPKSHDCWMPTLEVDQGLSIFSEFSTWEAQKDAMLHSTFFWNKAENVGKEERGKESRQACLLLKLYQVPSSGPPTGRGRLERNHFSCSPFSLAASVWSDHMQNTWNVWILKGNIWRHDLVLVWCMRQEFGYCFFFVLLSCLFIIIIIILHLVAWVFLDI